MAGWNDGHPAGEHGWYRLDTNAVPPIYLLQPRPHDSPFADYGHWEAQVERPLRAILERAAHETLGASKGHSSRSRSDCFGATLRFAMHKSIRW